ncbi:zinc ABC transporter substrate-binding protein [Verrucomicrobiaceae bacterium 5K15]|uniref:Zinc ABC transporter substrate-binding protein n=2 Tax=Oceaniferula flava TaxID=2800421 RepID=A0AAE2VCH4_9BACT|nr:zinc ABC transporter substrate-binding protein [Oceaniferula flavus]MBM1136981.1 zinc ABC transporter substrate-binding protein [Oceaniferula flavus]
MMKASKVFQVVVATWLLLVGGVSAQIKVASLHPLISDVARNVGGQHATIVQLIEPHADPHHFRPTPKDLTKARGAVLYLASGKNLETYLDKLRSTLGKGVPVIEVGRKIPSEKISGRNSQYVCCPQHANGSIDPHWWHRVSNMQKAARIIASEFGKVDPAHAKIYKANAAAYSRRLEALDAWVKREVSRIPRSNRILTTAHAAFGYYCKEYGFKSLPVKGLTASHKTSAAYQAQAIQEIRKNHVKAIFPELRANPKAIAVISRETGVKLGGSLVADGASNYEKMMRDNTNKIVAALAR